MQLGKTSRTSVLILLSHAGRAPNSADDIDRVIAALASLGDGPATWVLAEQTLSRLEPSTRQRLSTRIADHDDDVILQGAYGIPHGVLGDRELHFEIDVTRRAAARALEIPEARIRDLMAPTEPDATRLAALTAGRPVILGASPHRGFHRLWVTFDGRHVAFPLIRLDCVHVNSWWRRHAALTYLGRGSPGVCAVDPQSREAIERLERLAPSLTAVPLVLPASPEAVSAPSHLEPLIPVERTSIWHARLLSAAAARPKTRRGRVSAGVLRPFAAGPEELVRETSYGSPLYENRVVHASMQGSARMTEGELTAQFAGGTCVGLASSPTGPFPLRPDPGSMRCDGMEWPFQVSGAFSFDWDTARGQKRHVVFIDEGHGLTWEPAVQITGNSSRLDLYLLPFGRFETAATGITAASILFALSLGDEVPDVTALRKRVLRVLPAPSAMPAGPAGQGSPT